MKKIRKTSFVAINLSKTILYSLEYKLLYQISNLFSFMVRPPKAETDKDLIEHLQKNVIRIHNEDAQNILDGYYSAKVLIPKSPTNHILKLPKLIIDSLRISRRRKLNLKKDFDSSLENIPEYFNRNFHFQTDGYFSAESASLYEHQVEVLFSGTAAPMRRMLIKFLKDKMSCENFSERPLRILELGAGVGTASIDFCKSFNVEKYVISDPSGPYLEMAKKE